MNRSVLDSFGSAPSATHDQELLLQEEVLGDDRAGAIWAEQLGRGRQSTDQKDQKPRHDGEA